MATLAAGQSVTIRFAFSGEIETCFKVAAGANSGYLKESELTGLEAYQNARASATDRNLPTMIRAEVARLKSEVAQRPAGKEGPLELTVSSALKMLDSGQPRQALELLETAIQKKKERDPVLLSVAGLAAYQSDDPRRAVEFWSESLSLRPNASVERLYQKAQGELAADQSKQKVHGSHFVLRYDQREVPDSLANEMMGTLEQEWERISATLGCSVEEKIVAVVQNRTAFQAATEAQEWSGGQYDGRIRIPLDAGGRFTPGMRQAFAHEIVHACLAQIGHWPAWFNEGMAQKLSGETLSARESSELHGALRSGEMPKLANLSQSFSRLSAQHARLAYSMSLAGVDAIYRWYGEPYIRTIMVHPEVLPQLADEVSRRLPNE